MTLLEQLAEQTGFHNSYTNIIGETVYASNESRKALLKAMGYTVDNEQQIGSELERIQREVLQNLLPDTVIINVEDEYHCIDISVPESESQQNIRWEIVKESGQQITGSIALYELEKGADKTFNSLVFCQYKLMLPKLPEGYHNLEANLSSGNNSAHCNLIVAPKTCYGPEDVADFKLWGFTAQLYSLKSDHSWGIGDFSDLHKLVSDSANKGASTIGLNPLHPLFPGNTAHRSPYSPSSRSYLNTIYIDVTQVPDYAICQQVKDHINGANFQSRLQKAKALDLIDYPLCAALKYEVLELLYEHFVNNHLSNNSELAREFNYFRRQNNNDLNVLATYDALYEHFIDIDHEAKGWMSWPVEYHDHKSDAVQKYQAENRHRIGYFEYIQWIAHQQLSVIANSDNQQEFRAGLYLDLAVGCDPGGADVWANRSVHILDGSVGAPPDALNLLGQDWRLTPINPLELKKQGYQPLVKALRNNMQYAGALRIDHVLGYMRQYWVAPGMKADQGIYITFPFEDMLRIIALESRRAKCIVIGEDLGTTPEGFGEIMSAAGVLSYRVLFFERWENGLFIRPDNYPEQSMVTVSTHDLPTITGWWTGNDLEWKKKLKLYPDEKMANEESKQRLVDRERLIAALVDMDLLDSTEIEFSKTDEINIHLLTAIQRFLALSPGKIQLIPMEDALGLKEQVNIPGTIDEHPNWLQKLPLNINEIWFQDTMQLLIRTMNQERPNKALSENVLEY